MKKRKNKNKIVQSAMIFGAILISFLLILIGYKINNRFLLQINQDKVSEEEYCEVMKLVEYDTKVEIQQKYDCDYTDDFWEKKYNGKYGYEILTENTIEELKRIYAVYEVAEENGDIKENGFAGLEKRWKKENHNREEKIKNGEVVYGVKEYTFELYLQYEMSRLKEAYCNDKSREGMALTEEEILKHYNSHDWIYGENGDKADLETARISVERELREKKYEEIVEQKAKNSKVGGEMKKISRFTLKNI